MEMARSPALPVSWLWDEDVFYLPVLAWSALPWAVLPVLVVPEPVLPLFWSPPATTRDAEKRIQIRVMINFFMTVSFIMGMEINKLRTEIQRGMGK